MRRSSITNFKKQPPEMFYKKAVLKKFGNIHQKKRPAIESLSNEVADLKPAALLTIDSKTSVFL